MFFHFIVQMVRLIMLFKDHIVEVDLIKIDNIWDIYILYYSYTRYIYIFINIIMFLEYYNRYKTRYLESKFLLHGGRQTFSGNGLILDVDKLFDLTKRLKIHKINIKRLEYILDE